MYFVYWHFYRNKSQTKSVSIEHEFHVIWSAGPATRPLWLQKIEKKERKIERTEIVRDQNTEDMLASAEETECAASHWNWAS